MNDDDAFRKRLTFEGAIALLAAWSHGHADEADPLMQELAIRVARNTLAHVEDGTSPIAAAPDGPSGSMADAGAALGQELRPIVAGDA